LLGPPLNRSSGRERTVLKSPEVSLGGL